MKLITSSRNITASPAMAQPTGFWSKRTRYTGTILLFLLPCAILYVTIEGLVDYLVVKVTRSGGLWPSLQQLAVAAAAGLPFLVSGLTDSFLSLTMANLSGENFWGGPTYTRAAGYVQLAYRVVLGNGEWPRSRIEEYVVACLQSK